MRRIPALALILIVAGCGGHAAKKHAATTSVHHASPVDVTIVAATHHPKVNKPWPVTIRVTDTSGKPLRASLWMQILFNGTPVGKVDNGHVYHFVGSWHERKGNEITWPKASRGQPLEFEVIVRAQHTTIKKTWSIQVR